VQKLDGAGETLFVRIENTARDLGERFDVATKLLEDITGDITLRFDGAGERLSRQLNTASTTVMSALSTASKGFAEGLEETTGAITGRFEQTTAKLVERIDSATSDMDDRAGNTARRLQEAGEKFAGHVATANQFLSEKLGESAKELDGKLDGISTSLTGKLEATSNKVATRLEKASHAVESSIDRFDHDVERLITDRQATLDTLVKQLAAKAEDVDAMMRNHVSLIQDSLNSAHNRSEDIARLMVAQAKAASESLQAEIGKLEQASDGQIAAAAKALNEQYKQIVAQMHDMLGATTGDFAKTAQEMRVTAQQVVKEVDFARSELKRAILDLPDETRANADAMRRVVSDQITALNALADVVKRQSGLVDLSGPGIYLPPDEGGGAKPGKTEGAPSNAPQERTAGTPKTSERGDEDDTAERPHMTVRGRPVERLLSRETPKSSADLLPQLTPAAKSGNGKSAAPVGNETKTLVAKLNSASRDIVEAVETQLPPELEKRYDAGETHVYSQHLYRNIGPKMQARIKRSYTTDKRTRGRVDAFCRLFERLLDAVQQARNGDQLVDACLASESGKLYLMLAQASGRLDK